MESGSSITKQRIIECAIELYKQKGFEQVTIRDICAQCGITRGAFYYHFDSKDAILDDYFSSLEHFALNDIAPVFASSDYVEQFFYLFDMYLQHTIDAGPVIMEQILKRSMSTGNKLFHPDHTAMRGIYTALLEKAQQAGQINNMAPAGTLVDAIVYLADGISLVWCSKKGDVPMLAEHHAMIDALLMRAERDQA